MHLHALHLLAAFLTIARAIATPKAESYTLHEKRQRSYPAWQLVSRAVPEAVVPVRIGLGQSNVEEGMRLFDDITDFYSPNYGKWWSPERIRDFFAPHYADVENVRLWLTKAGVHTSRISQSVNKQWIQFDAPISELEALLRTEYHEYEHTEDGRIVPACDQYHVPHRLSEVIDYITPGIRLGQSRSSRPRDQSSRVKRAVERLSSTARSSRPVSAEALAKNSTSLANCGFGVTPACMFAAYNITAGSTATSGNELGLFEAPIYAKWSQTDLDDFFKTLYPKIPPGTHPTLDPIDGAPNTEVPAADVGVPEGDLDLQSAYPITWPQNIAYFAVGDSYYNSKGRIFGRYFAGFVDDFLYAIDGSYCNDTLFGLGYNNSQDPPYPDHHKGGYKHPAQCGLYKAPNVVSTSYDATELDVDVNFSRRQCLEWMKLGMQGTSVLVASGDSGVSCDTNDNSLFAPDYTASCPYVTAVGATTIFPGNGIHEPQAATTSFGSGGGFSNIFPRPAYQKHASYSTSYNHSVGTNGGVYNRIGRAYPDVAFVGQNIAGWYGGDPYLVDGTSASAPSFAAVLTRINEARLQQGKSTVGFVNPVLYAHPELLTDITIGSNPNNGSDSSCHPASPGFKAGVGWDPVTGLGTPRFEAMMQFWTS